jgi:hypothetical protein
MPSRCCAKPIAKIIKVGASESGIIGLEKALQDIYESGRKDENQIASELLRLVKECGNYITPGREADYEEALLREYRGFVDNIERKLKSEP